jgi:uncharacterized cofD-like protein
MGRRMRNLFKWLYPGMRVKRWFLLVIVGSLLVAAGVNLALFWRVMDLAEWFSQFVAKYFNILIADPALGNIAYTVIIGVPVAVLGVLCIFVGLQQVLRSITSVLHPETTEPMVDLIRRRRQLAQGQRVVVIGGGTGLATMLRGLKEQSSNITAVVTVTDDGGSSGRLIKDFHMLPPGDIRNCLVALADTEPLMQELFQYRFDNGSKDLHGHSFGNLLIAAMLSITGDFEEAVRQTSRVLAIRGRVLPSTLSHVGLRAELLDGSTVEGETLISAVQQPIQKITLTGCGAEPLDETLTAIATADVIVIGPGSVYTSIVPNFLVKGIAAAVANSHAIKVYVCNVMTQPGETSGYSASDHVRAVLEQAGARIFDYVLVNQERPSETLLQRYAEEGSYFVYPDVEKIKALGLRPVVGDHISQTHVVRHDPQKLAHAVFNLASRRIPLG